MSIRIVFTALSVIALAGVVSYIFNLPKDIGLDVPDGKLNSLSFAPFREGQNPLLLQFPTPEQIDEDLALMANKTHTIRTYSITGGMKVIPELARKHGLKMIQGAWIGYDTSSLPLKDKEARAEIEAVVEAANKYPDVIKRVIVGNEVLLRGEREPQKLVEFIREVKGRIKQPVSYADVWSMYMKYPDLIKEVDFITIHILPYWEDEPIPVDKAPAHIERIYKQVKQEAESISPGKPILIGESGWPAEGKQRGLAVPSVVNEAAFIRGLLKVAADNGFDVNIVEAFNQSWKNELEGVMGANWGLYSVDRKEVFPLTGKVYENPKWFGQFVVASLLVLLIAMYYNKKLATFSTQKLLFFFAFVQILCALLVFYVDKSWYTSYTNGQRLWTALVTLSNITIGVLVIQRSYQLLTGETENQNQAKLLDWLYLVVLTITLYKTWWLAVDGRYVCFPFELAVIPVVGLLGLIVSTYLGDPRSSKTSAWTNFNFNKLIGHDTSTENRNRYIGWILLLYMAGLVIGEIKSYMTARDFIQAYSDITTRLGWAVTFSLTNAQLIAWLVILMVFAIALLVKHTKQGGTAFK